MTTNAPEITEQRIAAIIARHGGGIGPLLPILNAVQDTFGHVPDSVLPQIAEALNLTRAEVYGVKSFYHDYRETPPGRHVIKLCRAEACQAMGARALAEKIGQSLGIGWGETTPDGAVTLEPAYCLGLCSCAPAALIDGEGVARLDAGRLDALIGEMTR